MAHDPTTEGIIFDIERCATHDGPGIRTTVFLKGCYLGCTWCHNPESMSAGPELMFDPSGCLADLACFEACDSGALVFGDHAGHPIPKPRIPEFAGKSEALGVRLHDSEACLQCGQCVDVCFARALEMVGRQVTVQEVFVEVERDRAFYGDAGGVTVSGGEPLYQQVFARELLAMCKAHGLHTALDTTAFGPWDRLQEVVKHTDLVLLDLKLMDGEAHRQHTGVDNSRILENARRMADLMRVRSSGDYRFEHAGIWVRVPVVPSINDDEGNLRATARFVRDDLAGVVRRVELLAYHKLGGSKSIRLGGEPPLKEIESPGKAEMEQVADLFETELSGLGIEIRTR